MNDTEDEGRERRKYPRSRMSGLAKISLGDPDKLMACVVQDCSPSGARLQLADAGRCPDSFVLIGADDWVEDCEVVWRRDDLIGVRFVKAVHPAIRWVEAEAQRQADAKAMDGIRSGVNERRKFPRTRVMGVGKITVSEQKPSMDCIVVDWSHGGAQLRLVEPDKCPDQFEILTKDGGVTGCLVVWRRDAYVGVRFLKP